MSLAKFVSRPKKTYRFEATHHWHTLHALNALPNNFQNIGKVRHILYGHLQQHIEVFPDKNIKKLEHQTLRFQWQNSHFV